MEDYIEGKIEIKELGKKDDLVFPEIKEVSEKSHILEKKIHVSLGQTVPKLNDENLNHLIESTDALQRKVKEWLKPQLDEIPVILKENTWYEYNGVVYQPLTNDTFQKIIGKLCIKGKESIDQELDSLGFSANREWSALVSDEFILPKKFYKKATSLCEYLTKHNNWVSIIQQLEIEYSPSFQFEKGEFISFIDFVLDVNNYQLLKHDKKYFSTYFARCNFLDLKPVSSRFRDWMGNISKNEFDQVILSSLWRYVVFKGTIMPFFLLYGPSGSSKSTLVSTAQLLCQSEGSVAHFSAETDRDNFLMMQMYEAHLVIFGDAEAEYLSTKTSLIKGLTGGDKYKQRAAFGKTHREIQFTGTIIAVSNQMPSFKNDTALKRRTAFLHCDALETMNPNFKNTLHKMLPDLYYISLCAKQYFAEKDFTNFGELKRDPKSATPLSSLLQELVLPDDAESRIYLSDLKSKIKDYGKEFKSEVNPLKRGFGLLVENTLIDAFGLKVKYDHGSRGYFFAGLRFRKPHENMMAYKQINSEKSKELSKKAALFLGTQPLFSVNTDGKILWKKL